MSNNKIQDIFTRYYRKVLDFPCVSREMYKSALNIIKCRTHVMNIHFEECPNGCGFFVLYDSCKHRGCPQCQTIENNKWLHSKKQLLLPGPHIHQVFKLPLGLERLWMFNKRNVAACLFTAVKKSFAMQKKSDGINRGLISVFHSAGKGLSYHPHIHSLVSIGGFSKDKRWIEKSYSYKYIEATYRSVLKKELIKLVKSKDFRNPPGMDCLKEICSLDDRSFSIFQSEVYKTGEGILSYLSKTIKSGPITEDDILDYNDKVVILKYRDSKKTITLKVEEFMLRYLNHIPPKRFMVVRNYGLYANTNANKTKEYKQGLGIKIDDQEYQIPKLECPKCGKQVEPVKGMSKKKLKNYCLEKCA